MKKPMKKAKPPVKKPGKKMVSMPGGNAPSGSEIPFKGFGGGVVIDRGKKK